jgi:acetate kinase
MGVEFDAQANKGKKGKEVIISKPGSKVTLIVVPTNEELVIAQDTAEIVGVMKEKGLIDAEGVVG